MGSRRKAITEEIRLSRIQNDDTKDVRVRRPMAGNRLIFFFFFFWTGTAQGLPSSFPRWHIQYYPHPMQLVRERTHTRTIGKHIDTQSICWFRTAKSFCFFFFCWFTPHTLSNCGGGKRKEKKKLYPVINWGSLKQLDKWRRKGVEKNILFISWCVCVSERLYRPNNKKKLLGPTHTKNGVGGVVNRSIECGAGMARSNTTTQPP